MDVEAPVPPFECARPFFTTVMFHLRFYRLIADQPSSATFANAPRALGFAASLTLHESASAGQGEILHSLMAGDSFSAGIAPNLLNGIPSFH
jgi:hypothetical protein